MITHLYQPQWTGTSVLSKVSNKMSELASITPTKVIDARGSSCPGPILEAKKGIGKVKVGEVLEVISNDPGTKNDLPIWVKRVGHEFLGIIEEEGYSRLFIKRKK